MRIVMDHVELLFDNQVPQIISYAMQVHNKANNKHATCTKSWIMLICHLIIKLHRSLVMPCRCIIRQLKHATCTKSWIMQSSHLIIGVLWINNKAKHAASTKSWIMFHHLITLTLNIPLQPFYVVRMFINASFN